MTKTDELVREFSDHVAAQTDAIGAGDPQSGNRHARRYIRAFESLRALGNEGRDALVPLMFTGRDDVRAMAAAFLLRHRTEDARRVLEELGRGKGLTAFGAGEALKRWEEGVWALDPANDADPG